jgi:hypothetical protein
MADPEYYGLRNQAAGKASDLMGGLDPNAMSAGEMEQITRGLNRTGVSTGTNRIPSSSAAISNALTFGDRLMQKKKDVAGIMSTIPGLMTATRSGIDINQQVTGSPAYTANVGSNYGAVPLSLGQQYLTETGQNSRTQSTLQAQARDSLDRFNETFGSIMGGVGGGSGIASMAAMCWIAREVYGEDNPNWKLFRIWLLTKSPNWFTQFYLKFGQSIAYWLRNKPTIKYFIRLWMNSRINKI